MYGPTSTLFPLYFGGQRSQRSAGSSKHIYLSIAKCQSVRWFVRPQSNAPKCMKTHRDRAILFLDGRVLKEMTSSDSQRDREKDRQTVSPVDHLDLSAKLHYSQVLEWAQQRLYPFVPRETLLKMKSFRQNSLQSHNKETKGLLSLLVEGGEKGILEQNNSKLILTWRFLSVVRY